MGQMISPANSVKELKKDRVLRTGFNPIRSTSPCYNNITHLQLTQKHKTHAHKHKWIYTQSNGPSETKPNPENCSSKCAYDCAQL